jgi:hypothetical protein
MRDHKSIGTADRLYTAHGIVSFGIHVIVFVKKRMINYITLSLSRGIIFKEQLLSHEIS